MILLTEEVRDGSRLDNQLLDPDDKSLGILLMEDSKEGSTLGSQLLDQSEDQEDEYDEEALDELEVSSHLQQPAPCQKLQEPS
jgi:hypothetical protein